MAKPDPRIDALIEKSADFAKPILRHIRKLVRAACPEVEETLKWRMPAYMHKGIICMTPAFKRHCALIFWHPSVRKGLKSANSKDDWGGLRKIIALSGLPPDSAIKKAVKESVELNESGKKNKRPTPTKKPMKIPPYFMAFLRKNKKALAAFQGFSPSHQREYVTWITEAKQESTRQRRLAEMVKMLIEGKSRNWKYER